MFGIMEGRFFVFYSLCRAAYKHHGGGMICHAPCSSTILSCIHALTWCGIASGEWHMFALYVLIFSLSFRVLLWHTSQGGGGRWNENDWYYSNGRVGRPSGIFMCWVFGRYPIFASSAYFWILIEGRIWYVLISNGWGLCAFRMLIMCWPRSWNHGLIWGFWYWLNDAFPVLPVVLQDVILMWCWFLLEILPRIFLLFWRIEFTQVDALAYEVYVWSRFNGFWNQEGWTTIVWTWNLMVYFIWLKSPFL